MSKNETNGKGSEKVTPTTEPKILTPEQIRAIIQENESLKQKIAEVPQNLEARLNYFNQKQELIKRLRTIDSYTTQINQHIDKITEAANSDEFTSEEFSLSIKKKTGYSSEEDLIRLRQPALILEVINFVLGKVGEKRKELQKQIEA